MVGQLRWRGLALRGYRLGILVLSCSVTVSASAQEPASNAAAAPPYKLLRYDEDYRYLSEPGARSDPWDRIKFIPLGSDSGQWLSLGGELRERFEYYSAPNFGIQGEPANGYFLHRLLLHADLHLGDSARAFVQIASNLSSGRTTPPHLMSTR